MLKTNTSIMCFMFYKMYNERIQKEEMTKKISKLFMICQCGTNSYIYMTFLEFFQFFKKVLKHNKF